MNATTQRAQCRSMLRAIPRRKEIDVYAAPTTEVNAAAHITTPKIR
jgi:hypothetical protein